MTVKLVWSLMIIKDIGVSAKSSNGEKTKNMSIRQNDSFVACPKFTSKRR